MIPDGSIDSDAAIDPDAAVDPDAATDPDGSVDQCEANHFGADCAPCSCKNGECNDGHEGDGHCISCTGNFFGIDCDQDNISCVHGQSNVGTNGDGRCATCDKGFDIAENCAELLDGYMTDASGRAYLKVEIDGREWIAENMAYQTEGITCKANTEDDADFVADYSCLYNWDDANKICPTGWHLPTDDEFQALLDYVSENKTSESVFLSLIAPSEAWTAYPNEGSDEFGFGALPVGGYFSSHFSFFGTNATFWSSTEGGPTWAYDLLLGYEGDGAFVGDNSKSSYLSVRCIKGAE